MEEPENLDIFDIADDRTNSLLFDFIGDYEKIASDLNKGRVFRLHDRFFKYLFGSVERKSLALSFINGVVFPNGEKEFVDIEYKNRELVPAVSFGRECRLDIVGYLALDTQVNIEVQVRAQDDYLKRAVYYTSLLHSSQLERGGYYGDARATISINLLGFDLFADRFKDDYRNAFSIRHDVTNEQLSDELRLIFIEMPKYKKLKKLPKDNKPMSGLERWMLYFTGMEANKMPYQVTSDKAIKEAITLEKVFFSDEENRLAYFTYYKALKDDLLHDGAIRRNAERKGREEGIKIGEEKGSRMEKIKTAKALLALNMPIDNIITVTGMSHDEILKLQSQS